MTPLRTLILFSLLSLNAEGNPLDSSLRSLLLHSDSIEDSVIKRESINIPGKFSYHWCPVKDDS